MSDIKELTNHAYDFAAKMVMDKGDVQPFFHAVDVDNTHYVIFVSFQNDVEKQVVKIGLRGAFILLNIEAYVFASEAWVKTFSAKDSALEQFLADGRSVSDYKDRKEQVFVAGVSSEERHVRAGEIVRDQQTQKVVDVRSLDTGEHSELGGDFSGMLAPAEIIAGWKSGKGIKSSEELRSKAVALLRQKFLVRVLKEGVEQ